MNASDPAAFQELQTFFSSGETSTYAFRKEQLLKLKQVLYKYEEEIYKALYTDLAKNREESWVTEIGFTIAEINHTLKHLKKWMGKEKVRTNLVNFPSKSYILPEPLGVVLIIGPWNYPLQLLLSPLVGALAAGNCVVLKPSEQAPATSELVGKMIREIYPDNYVTVVEGDGAVVVPGMMELFRFDHIFYTGNARVGTLIYQQAAKKLVPVTLELGGKSPCIIEADADIKVAAKRIALTKFSNAGQMCVAPDYLLVHEKISDPFVEELKKRIREYYQQDDYHFGKIVNVKSFDRLVQHIDKHKVLFGGKYDRETLFIEPTLLQETNPQSAIMQEEIFGPLLPILTWRNEAEVYKVIAQNNNPLALYVFTSDDKKAEQWMKRIPFGGGCINNASWHLTNPSLPFGGRGNSGFGAYHGKYSFDTFSHKKAIMNTPTWFDPSIKYPPFKGKLSLFKKMIR